MAASAGIPDPLRDLQAGLAVREWRGRDVLQEGAAGLGAIGHRM